MIGLVVLFFDASNVVSRIVLCFYSLEVADEARFFDVLLDDTVGFDGFIVHRFILPIFNGFGKGFTNS